jgi:MFS transporter, DHA2 family, multidrug resistance protein
VQGVGMGLTFNPLSVLAFTTLEPRLRGDGAALLSLFRNIGSAIGVSVTSFSLAQLTQVSHADLAASITPFNRLLQSGAAGHFLNPSTAAGAGLLNATINRQAEIIAYNDDYRLLMMITLAALLALPLMRRARHLPPNADHAPDTGHAAMD